jgi:hypothetical protein
MNERIKKLYAQADKFAKENRTQNIAAPGNNYFELFHEKFAELIIGHATECVRDVLRDENSDLSYVAATQVQNRIKEFFGVEE